MARNIVILFDGTSNEISADRTNILRLFGVLRRSDSQIVYYDPGVGTFGAANAWSNAYRKTVEVWGLATGWGLDQNVKDAYRFIVENYEHPPRGQPGGSDRIYIFGFSRGAYSARVLAGFIHALGLMSKVHLNLVDYAYRTYKGIPESEQKTSAPDLAAASQDAPSAFTTMRLYERTLKTWRPSIKLLGLFDTVSSVIVSGKLLPQIETLPFTRRNPSVECVRQALAIDERRTMFNPLPWERGEYWGSPFRPPAPSMQNVKEVWFAGVHGDVGGGYPENQSAAVKIPLDWMIAETRPFGLEYNRQTIDEIVLGENPEKTYVRLNALGEPHDSMNLAWRLLEYLPRRVPETSWRRKGKAKGIYLPMADHRFIPEGASIHQSVLDRENRRTPDSPYSPPNLPSTFDTEPWPSNDGYEDRP